MMAAEIQTACAAYPRVLALPARGQSESTSRFGSATKGHGRRAAPIRRGMGMDGLESRERSAAEGFSRDLSVAGSGLR
jgi:hypothetical protein